VAPLLYQHNLTVYFFNYILHAQGFLEYFCRAMTGGLTTKYRVYTIADKNDRGIGARMPHCELKWEILIEGS